MPAPRDFRYPFIVIPFTILSGAQTTAAAIDMGDFTPVAMITDANWTPSSVTFTSYVNLGVKGLFGTTVSQTTGTAFSTTIAASSWTAMDPVIFGSGVTLFVPNSASIQTTTTNGYFIGAPLYTITK